MKQVAPDYYTNFRCVAGGCHHTCCGAGWEIDIDPDTYEYYAGIPGEFGKRLQDGIDHKEPPIFKMDGQGRCGFLRTDGLCDIICTLGEDALCDICTDHPRFRNFYSDRVEIGVGLCCEEACRLILQNPAKALFTEQGSDNAIEEEAEFFARRQAVFDILQDRSIPFQGRMEKLCPPDAVSPSRWTMVYRDLERLDSAWNGYLDVLKTCETYLTDDAHDTLWEQLAVYFCYRHLRPDDFDLRLAFCLHAVKIIQTIATAEQADVGAILNICRLYSGEIEYSDENVDRLMETII